MLWFGDERGYNATIFAAILKWAELWFGDERGYNATTGITAPKTISCGLVMKEDITQLPLPFFLRERSCGLVMKEDITQPLLYVLCILAVVVW